MAINEISILLVEKAIIFPIFYHHCKTRSRPATIAIANEQVP